MLRATANLSTGGTAIDRTDEMHPDNITACEMAAGAIGLDIAGIDVLTPDISVPFRENGAVIIEVNAAPGVRMHTHPTEGTPRNVGSADSRHAVSQWRGVYHSGHRGHGDQRQDDDGAAYRTHLSSYRENGRADDHGWDLHQPSVGNGGGHDGAVFGQCHPLESDGRCRRAGDCARWNFAGGIGIRRSRCRSRAQRQCRSSWIAGDQHTRAISRCQERRTVGHSTGWTRRLERGRSTRASDAGEDGCGCQY